MSEQYRPQGAGDEGLGSMSDRPGEGMPRDVGDMANRAQEYGEAGRERAEQYGDMARERTGQTGETAGQYGDTVREKAEQYGDAAREKASEYGEKAREQAGVAKDQAASGMERIAGMVRERAGGGNGNGAASPGAKVADGMETAASYLRSHELPEIWNDVESYARAHPAKAIAGAVVTGFVVGRILR